MSGSSARLDGSTDLSGAPMRPNLAPPYILVRRSMAVTPIAVNIGIDFALPLATTRAAPGLDRRFDGSLTLHWLKRLPDGSPVTGLACRDWREEWLGAITVSKSDRHTYFQTFKEWKSRSSRSANEGAPLVRELPLIALSVLSLGIWAPILVALTSLAVALVLAHR